MKATSSRDIAHCLNLVQSAVLRSINMHARTGSFTYSKPTGRHRATSRRFDAAVVHACKVSPHSTAKAIHCSFITISQNL